MTLKIMIMVFNIMTISTTKLGTLTLSIMTFCKMLEEFNITTIRIVTLGVMNDIKHNNTQAK